MLPINSVPLSNSVQRKRSYRSLIIVNFDEASWKHSCSERERDRTASRRKALPRRQYYHIPGAHHNYFTQSSNMSLLGRLSVTNSQTKKHLRSAHRNHPPSPIDHKIIDLRTPRCIRRNQVVCDAPCNFSSDLGKTRLK